MAPSELAMFNPISSMTMAIRGLSIGEYGIAGCGAGRGKDRKTFIATVCCEISGFGRLSAKGC